MDIKANLLNSHESVPNQDEAISTDFHEEYRNCNSVVKAQAGKGMSFYTKSLILNGLGGERTMIIDPYFKKKA